MAHWGPRRASGPSGHSLLSSDLLFVLVRVDADASSLALRIRGQRGQGHKDVIVELGRCHRVGGGRGRYVFDPGVGLGINDPEHRSSGEISRAEIVVAIAPIEPNLITATDLA